jgi:type I restriction enzyme R subunit
VDLLTTGIDVPAICNLVFLRRVNSRILLRADAGPRHPLCDFDGRRRQGGFRVFDAVQIFEALQRT